MYHRAMTQALAVKPFEQTKLYDFTMSLPLQAFYGWGVWTLAHDIANRYRELMSGASPLGWIGLSSQVLTLLFLSLLTFLLIIRRVPKAKSAGLMPRFCAIMGTVASITYSQIPLADLPVPLAILTMVPVILGTFLTVITALWLGRQFSIMPEARKLVTAGPYALVRHPLYFCEELALFGIALQHGLVALVVFGAQFTFQILRMDYEESVLTEAFPEYKDYAARTARLIPGVY